MSKVIPLTVLLGRYWSKIDRSGGPDACWPWTAGKDSWGYGVFSVQRKSTKATRWGYRTLIGPIPEGHGVLHHCDRPECMNYLKCWFTGTPADNNRDAAEKGRMAKGDRNGSRLYPERLVRGEKHHMVARPELRRFGDRNPMRMYPELARGENNPAAKLTVADVREIRALRQQGIILRVIAAQFGIGIAATHSIVTRKSWAHVD